MTRFLITGGGFPAYDVLRFIAGVPQTSIEGFVTAMERKEKGLKFALDNGISVFGLEILTGEESWPDRLSADWLININGITLVCADILKRFPGRALNMHPGPLPEYAGMHVHQWAIRNGETQHGATVHLMDAGVDTGPIIDVVRFPILPTDTGLSLFTKTMKTGTKLLGKILAHIADGGGLAPKIQDLSRRRYYRRADALGGAIDWNMSAKQIVDFVRAGNYEPLSSPTYSPCIMTSDNQPIIVRKCCSIDRSAGHKDERAGRFLYLTDNGPVIACGHDQAVLISKAIYGSRKVRREDWEAVLAGVQNTFPNL